MNISYSKARGDFYKKLHSKVETYFAKKDLDKKGNRSLHLFSFIIFLAFLGSYFGWILYGKNLWLSLAFTLFLGLSVGILGSISHEATHRTFAKQHWLNSLMLSFSDLIGKSSYKYQKMHFFHHNYTNINHVDPDIGLEPLLRLSPFQKRRHWHRFQHLYAWFVYSLAAFYTVYNIFTYNQFFSEAKFKDKLIFWLGKLSHITLFIIVPFLLLGWQSALLGYVVFMMIAGFYISIIIQPSHLFTTSEFVEPDINNKINEEWMVHMIKVTSNYPSKWPILTYIYAGMNYHIVHQLFPDISFVHYPQLNKIAQSVALNEGLPYKEFPNLFTALKEHYFHLKQLSKS